MDGRGNEGHTESQPHKNIPLRKQSYKLSHPSDFDVAVSTALLKDSALEDNPVSNSLDLTSSTLYSMVVMSE